MASLSVKMNKKTPVFKKEKRAENNFFLVVDVLMSLKGQLKNLPVNGSVEAVRTLHIQCTDLRTVVS